MPKNVSASTSDPHWISANLDVNWSTEWKNERNESPSVAGASQGGTDLPPALGLGRRCPERPPPIARALRAGAVHRPRRDDHVDLAAPVEQLPCVRRELDRDA